MSKGKRIYEANEEDYEFDEYGQIIANHNNTRHQDDNDDDEPPYEEEHSHDQKWEGAGDELLETGLPKKIYWEQTAMSNSWKAALNEYKHAHPARFPSSTAPPLSDKEKHNFAPLWYGLTPSPIASTSASASPSTSAPSFPIPPLGTSLPPESTPPSNPNQKKRKSKPQKQTAKRPRLSPISTSQLRDLQNEFKGLQKELLELEKSKFGLGEEEIKEVESVIQGKRTILIQMKVDTKEYQRLLSKLPITEPNGTSMMEVDPPEDITWSPQSPSHQRSPSPPLPPPITAIGPQLPKPPPITPLSTCDLLLLQQDLNATSSKELLEKCLWNWYTAGYETAMYHFKCMQEQEGSGV